MTLPAMTTLCRALNEFPDELLIHFPGGATLVPQLGLPPSLLETARAALGQANTALAPLQPIFDVIETLVAIQKCITAIPDALGPPPDPRKLSECLPTLAEKIEALIALLPPASVLRMIVEMLDAVICMLQGTIAELHAILRLMDRIAYAAELAARCPTLEDVMGCGRESVNSGLDNIVRALASLHAVFALLNGLLALAGLAPMPLVPGSFDGKPDEFIDVLQGTVTSLRAFRDTIPVG